MDDLIVEQLEALLSERLYGPRFGRRLLLLIGALGEEGLSEPLAVQVRQLSRLAVLQDLFESLMEPINQAVKSGPRLSAAEQAAKAHEAVDLAPLMQQIEDTRLRIIECGDINYAEITAWIFARAKEQKLWRRGRGSR